MPRDFASASPSQTGRVLSPGGMGERREKGAVLGKSLNYREGCSWAVGNTAHVVHEGKRFYHGFCDL